jgi:hypothetical protein
MGGQSLAQLLLRSKSKVSSIRFGMSRVIIRGAVCAALLATAGQPSGHQFRAHVSAESAVVGTVAQYEVATRALTVKVDKTLQTFVLANNASVHLGSRVLPDSDIGAHVGRRAKVRFVESDGKRVARTVMISRTP